MIYVIETRSGKRYLADVWQRVLHACDVIFDSGDMPTQILCRNAIDAVDVEDCQLQFLPGAQD